MDGIRLDYQQLRAISPQAARQAILQILEANKRNVTKTASILGVTRKTIYKAIRKKEKGNLDNLSHTTHHIVNKTSIDIETKVIELKNKTNYGPLRLKEELLMVYPSSSSLQLSDLTLAC
jgi:DNA-binding phage protein